VQAHGLGWELVEWLSGVLERDPSQAPSRESGHKSRRRVLTFRVDIGSCRHFYEAFDHVVADGVVDQVCDESLGQAGIAREGCGCECRADVEPELIDLRVGVAERVF
jgi:hypothetical protein